MKILIGNQEMYYGDRVRLVTNLLKRDSPEEYPEKLKWSLQMLLYEGGRWIEICRIDNYPHGGKVGSHVHKLGEVKRLHTSYEEATRLIFIYSKHLLLEKFGMYMEFDE